MVRLRILLNIIKLKHSKIMLYLWLIKNLYNFVTYYLIITYTGKLKINYYAEKKIKIKLISLKFLSKSIF